MRHQLIFAAHHLENPSGGRKFSLNDGRNLCWILHSHVSYSDYFFGSGKSIIYLKKQYILLPLIFRLVKEMFISGLAVHRGFLRQKQISFKHIRTLTKVLESSASHGSVISLQFNRECPRQLTRILMHMNG